MDALVANQSVVLCIGSRNDLHVKAVESKIKDSDNAVKFLVFNPLSLDHYIDITLGSNSQVSCAISVGEQRIYSECITAVWYRWQPAKFSSEDSVHDVMAKDFVLEEWRNVILSLKALIPHAIWMNSVQNTEQIKSKAFQLRLALECGLQIPLSKVTNDAASVHNLFVSKPARRIISKPLIPLFMPPDKQVRTREISQQFAVASSPRISTFPGVFQELITRRSDLCIAVVGAQVFAARVSTEKPSGVKQKKSAVAKSLHSVCKVPETLEKSLLSFHRKAGLVFGIYDFLEVRENDFIFVDCHPCGSWLWLEDSLGHAISTAVAKTLVGAQIEPTEMAAMTLFKNL